MCAALILTKHFSPRSKPNIVFVFRRPRPHAIELTTDGSSRSINPVIDRLASEGMLFVSSFCTNSICGPSRTVIQTGKHSHRNGFMNNGKPLMEPATFPKLLQKAGYQTAIYGKAPRANPKVTMTGRCFPDKDCITTPTWFP